MKLRGYSPTVLLNDLPDRALRRDGHFAALGNRQESLLGDEALPAAGTSILKRVY